MNQELKDKITKILSADLADRNGLEEKDLKKYIKQFVKEMNIRTYKDKIIMMLLQSRLYILETYSKRIMDKFITEFLTSKEVNLSQMFLIERVWRAGAKVYVGRLLRKLGAKHHYTSKSGSMYYILPDEGKKIRVSDHHVPETEERAYNRSMGYRESMIEIILNDMIPLCKLNENLLEIFEEELDEDSFIKYQEKISKIKNAAK